MRTFKDTEGRAWDVAVNVAAIKRVRSLAGVDLYGLVEDRFEKLGAFLGDPVQLVDALYALCKPQADARGVTDEQFGAAMAGDCIAAAAEAFLAEYTDFFPDPRVRAGLAKVLEKARAVEGRLMALAAEAIDRVDVDSVVSGLSGSFTSSLGPSASTPAP